MKTIAELVDDLFRNNRKPSNGREYSYTEVSNALGGTIDPSHLSKLRYGQIKNPNRSTLLALCRFFKVSSTYFFPELQDIEDEIRKNSPLTQEETSTAETPLSIATRSAHISPAVRKKLEQLIKALEEDEEGKNDDTTPTST